MERMTENKLVFEGPFILEKIPLENGQIEYRKTDKREHDYVVERAGDRIVVDGVKYMDVVRDSAWWIKTDNRSKIIRAYEGVESLWKWLQERTDYYEFQGTIARDLIAIIAQKGRKIA